MTEAPQWLTVQQVADELQANADLVRRWIRDGKLPAILLGSKRSGYRVARADLDTFLEALRDEGREGSHQ